MQYSRRKDSYCGTVLNNNFREIDERLSKIEESPPGENGYSPTVDVSKQNGVTTVKITDVNGEKTAMIEDGKDGTDGKSAYEYARLGGYTGTESEFMTLLANSGKLPTLGDFGVTASATELNYVSGVTSKIQTQLDGKLSKTTYEYNAELTLGKDGKVCIGRFPMYDSNISVEIKSTTNKAFNGTLIIATQNINTTGGGTYSATVFGDASNTLTDAIRIHYGTGSNVFSVYIDLPSWSKNLVHVQCAALKGTPTNIATSVSEIPSEATIVPKNALMENFANVTHEHKASEVGVVVDGDNNLFIDGKQVSVGGGSVTPVDWSINDENKAGYVKNRTHWKEIITEKEILFEETNVNFVSSMGSLSGIGLNHIVVDRDYVVYWNGNTYVCKAFSKGSSVILGNGYLVSTSLNNTGEPFGMEVVSETSTIVMKETSDRETVSIKIEISEEVVYHKIQKEYLPEDMVFGFERVEILPGTNFVFEDGQILLDTSLGLMSDAHYEVYWDGVKYECEVRSLSEDGVTIGFGLGNIGAATGGTPTEEPFFIMDVLPEMVDAAGVNGMILALDGSESSVISIVVKKITKISKDYLDIEYPMFDLTNYGEITGEIFMTASEDHGLYGDILVVPEVAEIAACIRKYRKIRLKLNLKTNSSLLGFETELVFDKSMDDHYSCTKIVWSLTSLNYYLAVRLTSEYGPDILYFYLDQM